MKLLHLVFSLTSKANLSFLMVPLGVKLFLIIWLNSIIIAQCITDLLLLSVPWLSLLYELASFFIQHSLLCNQLVFPVSFFHFISLISFRDGVATLIFVSHLVLEIFLLLHLASTIQFSFMYVTPRIGKSIILILVELIVLSENVIM